MEKAVAEKVKAFIENHLKSEFTLAQVAEYAGYSPFHLAREFKGAANITIMEYTRDRRIRAAAEELAKGVNVCDTAMEYLFDTHAGFTKAFSAVFGCTPKQYQEYSQKMKTVRKEVLIMPDSKIVIRHICKDDVQDLWENVYSAMTPRQITEEKIMPAIEAYKREEGLELVAEVDGKVVMSLPMMKQKYLPVGFLFDNNFTLSGGDGDIIMGKIIDEMKRQSKRMNINTLISPQYKDSEPSKAMQSYGFIKVMESENWEYLMVAI